MLDVAHHRHTERRHMIRVKNALAAGLALTPAPVEFLLACTDYLGYIVGRFTAQGRANVDRLAPRMAAAGDEEGARVVADIERTLGETEAAVADLLAGAGRSAAKWRIRARRSGAGAAGCGTPVRRLLRRGARLAQGSRPADHRSLLHERRVLGPHQ